MQHLRNRIPHIMKATKTIHHPSNFLFFDTETKDSLNGKVKGVQRHKLWFGWVWGFRYESGVISRQYRKRFTTVEQFFDHINNRLDKSRPLYLIAHNLGFDLTICDWWDQTIIRGFELNYAVMEDPPMMLSYKWNDCKIICLDTFNYWKGSVSDMGKSLRIDKLTMPKDSKDTKAWNEYCFRDVEILGRQVTSLLDFLTNHDLGAFGMSAPSIAMSAFKHRFMKHEIYIHDREQVLQLERSCYYGGLVNNFFIGKSTTKKVYYVDVNSLYPAMMLKQFPVKLVRSDRFPKLDEVRSLMSKYGACARVKIKTHCTTYPKRYENRLCEVQGTFETFLCGPELQRAMNRRDILYIGEISYYEMKPIFAEYVEYLWNMRKEYKAKGDKINETMIKLLMNSLYGKFGMKGYQWYDFDKTTLENYYELHGHKCPEEYLRPDFEPIIDHQHCLFQARGLDHPIPLRHVSGKLQIKFPTGEHTESFCAIAAFVTAYAREHLRMLIGIAGDKQVLYCDTDSLFVLSTGYVRLKHAGQISDTELGKLKLEGISKSWEFRNAKDYLFDTQIKLKGIRKNATLVAPNTYEQDQFEGLKSVLKRGGKPYIEVKKVRKVITHKYNKGQISSDGWVKPFTLSD